MENLEKTPEIKEESPAKENIKPETKEETKTIKPEEKSPEKETFYNLLKEGKIKEGDKVGFTPEGAKEEKVFTVDASFLKLKTEKEEYYDKFKYNLK